MRVAIGNDHSAVELKEIIADYVRELGHEAINLGTDTTQSCDYPLYGEKVGRAVVSGEADLGIAICGTGLGISLAANKVKGVRACVCRTRRGCRDSTITRMCSASARVWSEASWQR